MYYLSCVQVVMSPTCLEVQDLAWTVSLFTGNVHNITLNMQLSWRSIKLTDLDIYYLEESVQKQGDIEIDQWMITNGFYEMTFDI